MVIALCASSGCMQEQLRVVVRAPSRVQVAPLQGRPEITSRVDGSIDVDGRPFVSADGRIRAFDLHRHTYAATGGDGYISWEHGPSLPLSIRVDDGLHADVCLLAGRYRCLEGLQIQTPGENVASVLRERHPHRVLGLILVIAPVSIAAVPIAATYAASDGHSDFNLLPLVLLGALVVPPLVVGLWHLFAPSHVDTFDLPSLRDAFNRGSL